MSLGNGAPRSSLIDSEVVRVVQESPGYLRVVFDNPPLNLFDPEIFAGLTLLQQYVDDEAGDVRVLVFESAHPDFFLTHLDFPRIAEVSAAPGGRSLIENWPLFNAWLSSAPVVSISKVRGRTLEWLPRHVGRARALEIVLSADDVDAHTAELYGLVNRALPDTELELRHHPAPGRN